MKDLAIAIGDISNVMCLSLHLPVVFVWYVLPQPLAAGRGGG